MLRQLTAATRWLLLCAAWTTLGSCGDGDSSPLCVNGQCGETSSECPGVQCSPVTCGGGTVKGVKLGKCCPTCMAGGTSGGGEDGDCEDVECDPKICPSGQELAIEDGECCATCVAAELANCAPGFEVNDDDKCIPKEADACGVAQSAYREFIDDSVDELDGTSCLKNSECTTLRYEDPCDGGCEGDDCEIPINDRVLGILERTPFPTNGCESCSDAKSSSLEGDGDTTCDDGECVLDAADPPDGGA